MTPDRATRPWRLLIVEDNDGDLLLLREALREAGLAPELTTFADGAEALAHVRDCGERDDAPVPDAVLLDLNLPKHGGHEVLAAIRSSRRWAAVPVAVISSSALPRDREEIERLRVDRFIIKPVDLDEFLRIGETVRQWLSPPGGGS